MALHTDDQQEIRTQWQARLDQCLGEASRGKRKLLLFVSSITLSAVVLGLFPTKIEALGIGFDVKDRILMVKLLSAVTIYSIIGFILYAWADLHILLRSYRASSSGWISEFNKGKATIIENANWVARLGFDFAFPLGYSGYALFKAWQIINGATPI